jgi:hypothetical protein
MSGKSALSICAFAASTAACLSLPSISSAAPPSVPELEAGSKDALVYVYRVRSFAGAVRQAKLSVDGTKAMVLTNNSCTYMRVPAGHHDFEVAWYKVPLVEFGLMPTLNISADLEPGKTYYYRYMVFGGVQRFQYQFAPVTRTQATDDWELCKYAPSAIGSDAVGPKGADAAPETSANPK